MNDQFEIIENLLKDNIEIVKNINSDIAKVSPTTIYLNATIITILTMFNLNDTEIQELKRNISGMIDDFIKQKREINMEIN